MINEISHVRVREEKCVRSQNYFLPPFNSPLCYGLLFSPFSLFQNLAGFAAYRFKLNR